MAIQKFELDKATDLDKNKLPIQTVNGVSPNASGDVIVNDYVTKLSVSGKTITYTKKDGSTGNITTQDTVYSHPSTHPASMITGLATVATSGSYNDLSNRPSIPATPKAYVTATYHSGSSWYRKWSDGYIEQGFLMTVSRDATVTKTLPCAMTSTNYVVTLGDHATDKNGFSWLAITKSTTSLTIRHGSWGREYNVIVSGY